MEILSEALKEARQLTDTLSTLQVEALVAVEDGSTVATKRRLAVVLQTRRGICQAVGLLRQLEGVEAGEAPREASRESILADAILAATDEWEDSVDIHALDRAGLRQVADYLRDGKLDAATTLASSLSQAAQDHIPLDSWNYMFTRAIKDLVGEIVAKS